MTTFDVFDIKSNVVDSVRDLFDTMLSMEAAPIDTDGETSNGGTQIAASLSFAGDLVGALKIQTSEAFAHVMTSQMLGIELEEIEGEEEIKDVLLEVCNIVGGTLKSSFNDNGLPCIISTPSITIGNNFDIGTLNMARYEQCSFRCQGHDFSVEVCVKLGAEAPPEAMKKLTSIDITKFKRLDIISTAGDTLIEMFDTMLSMTLESSDSTQDADLEGHRVVGSVSFAGDVMGTTSILVSRTFARIITSKISDTPLEEVQDDEEIMDIIGEMCNIIGGNLKSGFCDTGLVCAISPPSITVGENFKIETLNMARYERFAFRFYDHDIFLELCVKIDESAEKMPQIEGSADSATEKARKPNEDLETLTDSATEKTAPSGGQGVPVNDAGSTAIPRAKDQSGAAMDVSSDRDVAPNNLDVILDIPIDISVELGRTKMKIHELRKLGTGSCIILSNVEGESLDILANNKLIAKGEVVIENGKFGIRVTEIVDRMERIKNLR